MKVNLAIGALLIFFLSVILAVWPYRLSVVQHEKFNERSGDLSGQEYRLRAKLRDTPVNSAQFLKLEDELGMVLWQQACPLAQTKFGDAEQVFRATHAVLKARAKPESYDQDYVSDTQHFAGLLRDQGKFVESIDLYRETLAYDQQASKGVDDLKLARDYANIGLVQYFNALATEDKILRQVDFKDGEFNLEKSIEIYRKLLGPDAQEVGNELATKALVLRDMGREGEGLRDMKESQRIRALIKTPSTPP